MESKECLRQTTRPAPSGGKYYCWIAECNSGQRTITPLWRHPIPVATAMEYYYRRLTDAQQIKLEITRGIKKGIYK